MNVRKHGFYASTVLPMERDQMESLPNLTLVCFLIFIITQYSTLFPPNQTGKDALMPRVRRAIGSSSLTRMMGLHRIVLLALSRWTLKSPGCTHSICSPMRPSSSILRILSGRIILCEVKSIISQRCSSWRNTVVDLSAGLGNWVKMK